MQGGERQSPCGLGEIDLDEKAGQNIHDYGHSEERPLTMSADGTISEHSPQSIPWHQISKRSANYQTRFVMPSRNPSTTTPT
ncbi:hypothetical protein ACS0TY_013417 [Phlomoides rotata]